MRSVLVAVAVLAMLLGVGAELGRGERLERLPEAATLAFIAVGMFAVLRLEAVARAQLAETRRQTELLTRIADQQDTAVHRRAA